MTWVTRQVGPAPLTLVFVDELLVMAAAALLAFSAVINALAQLRFVRDLIPEGGQ